MSVRVSCRSLIFSPTHTAKKEERKKIKRKMTFNIRLCSQSSCFVALPFSFFVFFAFVTIAFLFFWFSRRFWPRLSVKRNSFFLVLVLRCVFSAFAIAEFSSFFDKVNNTYIYLFIVIKWANVERAEFKIVNLTIKSMGMAEWTFSTC